MKEQIITYETAKLTKEKGIELFEHNLWYVETKAHTITSGHNGNEYDIEYQPSHLRENCYCDNYDVKLCRAYPQSILQKYLRENHQIMINVFDSIEVDKFAVLVSKLFSSKRYYNDKYYDTYEEALEKGLEKALNLL